MDRADKGVAKPGVTIQRDCLCRSEEVDLGGRNLFREQLHCTIGRDSRFEARHYQDLVARWLLASLFGRRVLALLFNAQH